MINFSRFIDLFVGVPLVAILAPFRRRKTNAGVHKILIVKLAAAGDTILLVSVLREFRKSHPEAEIHWLVTPINYAIAKQVPYVNRILLWDRRLVSLIFKLMPLLRSEKYDAVVDLEQWSRGTVLIAFFTGAPHQLGFDTPGQHRALLFTQSVKKIFDDHEILDFYRLLSLLGPINNSTNLELMPTKEGELELEQFLKRKKRSGPLVVVHPGCGADGKPREWPMVSYGVLCHWLKSHFKADLVLTSGPEERKKTMDLNKLINGSAMDLGGRLSWDGLIALVDQADLVVSGNTGIMHVAAARKKKQVALHGPTNPVIWGPLNKNARVVTSICPQCPCLKLGFEYHSLTSSCMEKISVDAVKEAVSSLLDKQ